jgi:hypothetical protein
VRANAVRFEFKRESIDELRGLVERMEAAAERMEAALPPEETTVHSALVFAAECQCERCKAKRGDDATD